MDKFRKDLLEILNDYPYLQAYRVIRLGDYILDIQVKIRNQGFASIVLDISTGDQKKILVEVLDSLSKESGYQGLV